MSYQPYGESNAARENAASDTLQCYHCGELCVDDSIAIDDKIFCCNGCKAVYELLSDKDMCTYYNLEEAPGNPQAEGIGSLKYGFLDDEDIQSKLLEFSDAGISKVTLTIPVIHCASCIWLLEQLHTIEPRVVRSRVNFLKKQVTVTYRTSEITLREVVELLAKIGYDPQIRLEDLDKKERETGRKRLYMQVGVAGFAFGNIMLLSFPEYLAHGSASIEATLKAVFVWLNLVLSLPIVFFSGIDYIISAWKGLRSRIVNLDVPISIGILALFSRSVYEVVSGTGVGYFDSLTGFIFLLLVGKLFQAKTYETLSFERDYKSYFPLSVIRKDEHGEKSIPVTGLEPGNRIVVRNQELIPADSILMQGAGHIDYSFVTGESDTVAKEAGDVIYAGGRQVGGALELEVIQEVSRSYLSRLWNHDSFTKSDEDRFTTLVNSISKYFVVIVLSIALVSFLFWLPHGTGAAFKILTAILIVACPCALALATPFTLGTAMRILGQHNFYLKNAGVVERLSRINSIVFDKTGTLSHSGSENVFYEGNALSDEEKQVIKAVVRQSTHPLSVKIYNSISVLDVDSMEVNDFEEFTGKGIEALVNGKRARMGSPDWLKGTSSSENVSNTGILGRVAVELDGIYKGQFLIKGSWRHGLAGLINGLKDKFKLLVLSGDSEREKPELIRIFPQSTEMYFGQSPFDKTEKIESLQSAGNTVLMVGDGLNDAGALKTSDVGIAISEDITAFSPASDALLEAGNLGKLDGFLRFSKRCRNTIWAGFGISFLYNVIGLGFAIAGLLSPLVSAILMPLSSISVVVFATLMVRMHARVLK